jgi:carboxylesterase
VVLDDSYHMVTVDRQRHIVLERTASFVSRIAASLAEGMRAKEPARIRLGGGLATSVA